jgi:hypothetical protein
LADQLIIVRGKLGNHLDDDSTTSETGSNSNSTTAETSNERQNANLANLNANLAAKKERQKAILSKLNANLLVAKNRANVEEPFQEMIELNKWIVLKAGSDKRKELLESMIKISEQKVEKAKINQTSRASRNSTAAKRNEEYYKAQEDVHTAILSVLQDNMTDELETEKRIQSSIEETQKKIGEPSPKQIAMLRSILEPQLTQEYHNIHGMMRIKKENMKVATALLKKLNPTNSTKNINKIGVNMISGVSEYTHETKTRLGKIISCILGPMRVAHRAMGKSHIINAFEKKIKEYPEYTQAQIIFNETSLEYAAVAAEEAQVISLLEVILNKKPELPSVSADVLKAIEAIHTFEEEISEVVEPSANYENGITEFLKINEAGQQALQEAEDAVHAAIAAPEVQEVLNHNAIAFHSEVEEQHQKKDTLYEVAYQAKKDLMEAMMENAKQTALDQTLTAINITVQGLAMEHSVRTYPNEGFSVNKHLNEYRRSDAVTQIKNHVNRMRKPKNKSDAAANLTQKQVAYDQALQPLQTTYEWSREKVDKSVIVPSIKVWLDDRSSVISQEAAVADQKNRDAIEEASKINLLISSSTIQKIVQDYDKKAKEWYYPKMLANMRKNVLILAEYSKRKEQDLYRQFQKTYIAKYEAEVDAAMMRAAYKVMHEVDQALPDLSEEVKLPIEIASEEVEEVATLLETQPQSVAVEDPAPEVAHMIDDAVSAVSNAVAAAHYEVGAESAVPTPHSNKYGNTQAELTSKIAEADLESPITAVAAAIANSNAASEVSNQSSVNSMSNHSELSRESSGNSMSNLSNVPSNIRSEYAHLLEEVRAEEKAKPSTNNVNGMANFFERANTEANEARAIANEAARVAKEAQAKANAAKAKANQNAATQKAAREAEERAAEAEEARVAAEAAAVKAEARRVAAEKKKKSKAKKTLKITETEQRLKNLEAQEAKNRNAQKQLRNNARAQSRKQRNEELRVEEEKRVEAERVRAEAEEAQRIAEEERKAAEAKAKANQNAANQKAAREAFVAQRKAAKKERKLSQKEASEASEASEVEADKKSEE